jgi:hypothetical protein
MVETLPERKSAVTCADRLAHQVLLESDKLAVHSATRPEREHEADPSRQNNQNLYIERTLISPPPPAPLLARDDLLPALAVPEAGRLVSCVEVVDADAR